MLRLWTDDLLTVQHDAAWKLVLNRSEPFDAEWIDKLFVPPDATRGFQPVRTMVRVSFLGLPSDTTMPVADVDSYMPVTWVHIEDLRGST